MIDNIQVENGQLKQTISMIKKAKDTYEQQIQALTDQFSEMQRQYNDELQKTKMNCNTQIAKLTKTWQSKNNTLKKLLDKATDALTNSDEQNKQLVDENRQISVDKHQLMNRIELLKRDIEREKQIGETKLKAEQMSISAKCKSIEEEQKEHFINQKKEIYSVVANSFKSYYDSRQQLDEHSFKELLFNVSNDLIRLHNQENKVRNLLGIGPNEPLEEAITKLFLSQSH